MKTVKQLLEHMPPNIHRWNLAKAMWARGYNAKRNGAERFEGSRPISPSVVHYWLAGWDFADAEMIIEKGNRQFQEVDVGTILDNGIGCGMNIFYQVVKRSGNTVTARRIKTEHTDCVNQTSKAIPLKDQFEEDGETVKLRLKIGHRGALQIGPVKRMIWWSVWDGKPQDQWSP